MDKIKRRAQYMIRPPISVTRITYDKENQKVGRHRAKQIAEIEGGGHFIQDAGGNWIKR